MSPTTLTVLGSRSAQLPTVSVAYREKLNENPTKKVKAGRYVYRTENEFELVRQLGVIIYEVSGGKGR